MQAYSINRDTTVKIPDGHFCYASGYRTRSAAIDSYHDDCATGAASPSSDPLVRGYTIRDEKGGTKVRYALYYSN